MHHLREFVIDGVKFVAIPEDLHDDLARYIGSREVRISSPMAQNLANRWYEYDSEIFE